MSEQKPKMHFLLLKEEEFKKGFKETALFPIITVECRHGSTARYTID